MGLQITLKEISFALSITQIWMGMESQIIMTMTEIEMELMVEEVSHTVHTVLEIITIRLWN